MKCFVINLADQRDRWDAMAAQFAGLPLPVERFEAVRGADLGRDAVAALYSPELNRRTYHLPLTRGEIGCYASHLGAWRSLLESAAAAAVVFEDDVVFRPELGAVLSAIPELPAGWDMIKLFGRRRESAWETRPWIDGRRLIRYRRVPSFCSAYVISREGARRLLAAHVPFGRPVDIDLRHWWESGTEILGVQPYPVALAPLSSASTIGNRATPWNLAVKARRMFFQTRYHWLNWRATRRIDRSTAPGLAVDPGHPFTEKSSQLS